MARVAQQNGVTSLSELAGSAEICPVCSSGSYLNANLKFKLNPECYHKMCDVCVARIFRNGPAQCPYPSCTKTLRFARFRDLTFDDVRMEKEADIRRRMSRVFNKREADFESLLAYNDYLNTVEDITFDLVAGVDVDKRNREIAAYQEREARSIVENEGLRAQEAEGFKERQALERERARQRRVEVVREEEQERRERVEGQNEYIRKLQSSHGGARKIAGERERERSKKAQARRLDGTTSADGGSLIDVLSFAGLKKRTGPEVDKPYDPFDGLSVDKKYFVLQDDYAWDWLDTGKQLLWTAGGYDMTEYCGRALTEAFAGLTVFVEDEVRDRDRDGSGTVATEVAVAAAADAL